MGMKKYQCHKVVKAGKIVKIAPPDDTAYITIFIGPETGFDVDEKFIEKHNPQVGGYLVNYQDGYTSYSPAKAFESGYSLLHDELKAVNLRIAKVAHELNKAYCAAIGDHSQPAWEDAPAWQIASAIEGVHFHNNNPDAGADASHNSWMKQKVDDGWVYGEVKDPDKKTHPCIVPFDELPMSQQAKDFIFRQIVHSLIEMDL